MKKKSSTKSSKSKTHLGGRDSRTGQFIRVSAARQRSGTTTVERIPNPVRGDTGYIAKKRSSSANDRTDSTGPRISGLKKRK